MEKETVETPTWFIYGLPLIISLAGATVLFIALTVIENIFLEQGMGSSPIPPILGAFILFIVVFPSSLRNFKKQAEERKTKGMN